MARQARIHLAPDQERDRRGARGAAVAASRSANRRGACEEGPRPVARGRRHLHPSRLCAARPSGPIRRLVLPLPRLGLRHVRPHPFRPGADQSRNSCLRVPRRHQGSHRMSGHSTYQPQSRFMKWFEARLPVGALIHSSFVVYPTPRNLNYWWTFGGILTFMLAAQIVTGVVLAMHYTPTSKEAFDSVEQLMRDVNYGWLFRYVHANGGAVVFLRLFLPQFRGPPFGF